MKILLLLLLSLLCSSCALFQLPARLIHSALGPLVDSETPGAGSPAANVAIKIHSPAPKGIPPR